jgi:hypothetical protein
MRLQCHIGRTLFPTVLAACLLATGSFATTPLQDQPRKVKQTSPEKPQAADKARKENLPSADAVLDRHIEATGGIKAIKVHKYRTIEGDFEFVGAGLAGTFKIQQAAPNLFLLTLSAPQGFNISTGYDGEVAWSIDPMEGPRLFEGDVLAETKKDSDFYSDLNYAEHYPTREMLGKEEFNGTMCHKLKLTTADGITKESFYAIDTGLYAGQRGEIVAPQGKMKAIVTAEDYKTVDSLKLPHKVVVTLPDFHFKRVMTTSKMSHEEFSKDVFELPKEIQTLVALQAEERAEDEDGDTDGGNED